MAKKRRLKSEKQNKIEVESWQQADDLLKEAGDLQLAINAAEQKARDDINEAKAVMAEETGGKQRELRAIVSVLKGFCAARKKDFGSKKSRKLNYGTVGWRGSTKIKTAKKTLELIEESFTKPLIKNCINIKKSINKKELGKLTDEQLAQVGAGREEMDVFFAEPDLPEAVDYES